MVIKDKVLQNLIMINAFFQTCLKNVYQKTFWIIMQSNRFKNKT